MLRDARNNEFDMIARALTLYGSDDSRAESLKESMFQLLCAKQPSIRKQVISVQKDMFVGVIDLTDNSTVPLPVEDIDPIHVVPRARATITSRPRAPVSVEAPTPIDAVAQNVDTSSTTATTDTVSDSIQVCHVCVYLCVCMLFIACMCLFPQCMSDSRFRDRQPFANYECEKLVYVAPSKICTGYGLFAKVNIPSTSVACWYSGKQVMHRLSPDSNTWIANVCSVWGIDSEDITNFSGRWANHSLRNNARIALPDAGVLYCDRTKRHYIYIYTTRAITRGEEITVNYGKEFWTDDGGVSPYYYTYK